MIDHVHDSVCGATICVILHRNYTDFRRFVSDDSFEAFNLIAEFDVSRWRPVNLADDLMLEIDGLNESKVVFLMVPPDHGTAAYLFGDEGVFSSFERALANCHKVNVVLTVTHKHILSPPSHWPSEYRIVRLPPPSFMSRFGGGTRGRLQLSKVVRCDHPPIVRNKFVLDTGSWRSGSNSAAVSSGHVGEDGLLTMLEFAPEIAGKDSPTLFTLRLVSQSKAHAQHDEPLQDSIPTSPRHHAAATTATEPQHDEKSALVPIVPAPLTVPVVPAPFETFSMSDSGCEVVAMNASGAAGAASDFLSSSDAAFRSASPSSDGGWGAEGDDVAQWIADAQIFNSQTPSSL
jgi:hypothetical protein